MYALKLRSYAGGCLDLGGGDHPCTSCKWFAGLELDQNPRGFQENVVGYQCSRFVTIDGNVFMECADARRSEDICGLGGGGWEPVVESRQRATELFIDAAVSNAHCYECRHMLPWAFHAAGKSKGSPLDVTLCARYTLPVSGAPMPCTDARADASICGSVGNGFEAIVTPERQIDTVDDIYDGEWKPSTSIVGTFGADLVEGNGTCLACVYARLDVRDPADPADDEMVCTRFVEEVTGLPLSCDELRAWNGQCGTEGYGFKPIEVDA